MRLTFIRKLALNSITLLSLGVAPMSASTPISSSVILTLTSPATIYFGQNVDGYAQVNSSDGSPLTGTITFYDNNSPICFISTAADATCPASAGANFTAGTHIVTAVYSGDAEHSGSTSNTASVTVLQDSTVTSITSTTNSSTYGQSVTFTANVQGAHTTPSGSVRFLDGTNILGTATLTSDGTFPLSGSASFSTSTLDAGTHNISASYTGDATTKGSISADLTETVSPSQSASSGSFTISAAPVTVKVGQRSSVMVKISPANGFNQPVQLACANLPNESACTFGSAMIRAGGGSTTLQLSTMAPHDCGTSTSYYGSLPYSAPMAAALIMLLLPSKRQRRTIKGLLMVLAAFCGLTAMTGCANCTDLGTRPGTYTINVIGTAQGATAMTVSQKVTLKVTY